MNDRLDTSAWKDCLLVIRYENSFQGISKYLDDANVTEEQDGGCCNCMVIQLQGYKEEKHNCEELLPQA